MSEQAGGRRLLNATAVMASGTMISRILGLVRAMLIAFVLGNGTLRVEIFTFAMTVPNSLYMLLAGGTLNNVLVPQIVRAVLHDEDEGRAFIDRIMTGFLIVLGALTLVLTAATPWVMSIYTSATWRTPEMAEHWRSLLLMSYITMPQLFFFGVFFLIGQVLNARDRFGPMMWAPIANNVVSIAVFGAYIAIWGTQAASGAAFTDQQVLLLGLGSTLGIIVQTVVLVPYLRKAGFHYKPRFDLKGTGLGRTFHVAKWMVGYVALTSLAQVVVSNLASTATPIDPVTGLAAAGAGWNAYQNAYLIWILPHSLLTVSLATAMLPSASRYATAGDHAGVAAETTRAIRLATTFLLPAAAGFLVLSGPIARLIFGNGSGAEDYQFVGWTLFAFALGLVPFTLQYLYLRAFYALDNTRTPFLLQIWISGANALLALALVLPWSNPATVAPRLALAYSGAYLLGSFLTHRALKKRLPELDGRQTWQHLVHLSRATLPAAALAWVVVWGFERFESALMGAVGLAVAGVAAVLTFFFTAKRLHIPEATQLISVLRRTPPPVEKEFPDPGDDDPDAGQGAVLDPEPDDDPPPGPDGQGVFIPVAGTQPEPAGDLLDFPEPADTRPDSDPQAGRHPQGPSGPGAGHLLGGRYRLEQLLAVREGTQTWRALDQVLDRAVLIHLLPDRDPRTPRVLQLAREAAFATDARYLRVLDVVGGDPTTAPYLVYEYAAGQTLARILGSGPLSGAETAWIVREVADALIPLHAQGRYHRHLTPATVLVTTSGNVKILGLLVDDALREPEGPQPNPEAADVEGLGRLLYACLVARWPGGPRFGLAAAPTASGAVALPSQVHGAVPRVLDQVVERIISPTPRGQLGRLVTAADITTQLSLVLGPVSAANDLRARLHPATVPLNAGPASVSRVAPPIPTPPRGHPAPVDPEDPDEPDEATQTFVDSMLRESESFTPVPPPPPGALSSSSALSSASALSSSSPAEAPDAPKRRSPLIVGVLGLIVALGVLAAAATQFSSRTVATPAAADPFAIRKVDDFDPKRDGGSGAENAKQATLAIDGDPKTRWLTERYRRLATFGGIKPGVGLVVDLGSPRAVGSVALQLVGTGADLQLRVPAEPADTAPMRSADQWRTVAAVSEAGATATLTPTEPESTRYLLVYFTSLPEASEGWYRGGIAELVVHP